MFIVSLTFYVQVIPYSQGTHLKYFAKGRDVYDEYYGLLLRCSSKFDPSHKEIMYEKMEEWVRMALRKQQSAMVRRIGRPSTGLVPLHWLTVDTATVHIRIIRKANGSPSSSALVAELAAIENEKIVAGHPNAFICNPELTKKEWESVG